MSDRYLPTAALVRAEATLRDNPEQWQVYTSRGHQVVLAGPGSGKTHVVAAKVARVLASEVSPPQYVACVTYSNECVREFRSRLRRLGVTERHNAIVTTVHGFCLRHVLIPFARLAGSAFPHDPVVVTDEDRADLLNDAIIEEFGANRSAWPVAPHEVGGRVKRLRVRSLERSGSTWESEGRGVRRIVSRYEEALRNHGLVDFEAMILEATTLIRQHGWVREMIRSRFPVFVVDEYQDLGVPLDAMVVTLVRDAAVRLLAVGDPDQSIYGFTGTEPRLLRELGTKIGVPPIRLRLNYRSGRNIVRASRLVLEEERDYEARTPHAGEIFFYEKTGGIEEQAAYVCDELIPGILSRGGASALGEIAVLYPTRDEGAAIAEAAEQAKFQTQRIDAGGPYKKTPFARWLEDCASWCVSRPGITGARANRLSAPLFVTLLSTWETGVLLHRRVAASELEEHRVALADVLLSVDDVEEPLATWLTRVGVGFINRFLPSSKSYEEIRGQLAELIDKSTGGPLAAATVRSFGRQVGDPSVLKLVTLHSAKGLEFDSVILIGLDEGALPRWDAKTPEQLVEARRLFYVGLTRARNEVHLTYSGFHANRYGRRYYDGPSRFVVELEKRLRTGF